MLNNLLATNLGTYIVFGVMIVAIIGLFIWQSVSEKKKQKEAANMLDSLRKGDKVKTIGGICGYIVEINNEENTFVLETGLDDKKSYVKLDKGAIYRTAHVDAQAPAKAEEQPQTANQTAPKKSAPKKAKTETEPASQNKE